MPQSSRAKPGTAVEQRPQQRTRNRRRGASWLRRLGLGLVTLVLLAMLGFVLGPRPSLDPSAVAEPEGLPEEPYALSSHISERERAVEDLRFGTEAKVLWGDIAGHGEKTDLAFVYLHGFTASRQEITPVLETVARRLRANAYFPRLEGHGLDGAALGEASAQQWLADALEALRIGQRLGERVVLVGTSTGASLATWLAASYPEDVAGLVIISPNFAPQDERTRWLTGPWGRQIAHALTDGTVEFETRNEAHGRFWTREVPVEAVVEMMLLVEAAKAAPLEKISAPVWLLYHPEDPVVQPSAMLEAFERMPNPRNRATDISEEKEPEYAHILTGRHLSRSTTRWGEAQMEAFIKEALLEEAPAETAPAGDAAPPQEEGEGSEPEERNDGMSNDGDARE